MTERPTATAMTPRASWRDALDVQHNMVRWIKSQQARRWMYLKQEIEAREYDREDTRTLQQTMFRTVEPQLRDGVPFFVSREMCRLVEAAAETFRPEPIYPTDVLNLVGFLYYERPFAIPDRFDKPTTIRAISWMPVMDSADIAPDRLLTRDDEVMEWLEERHKQGRVDGLALTLYCDPVAEEWPEGSTLPMPSIVPMHMTPWWWGMTFDGNEFTEAGIPSGAWWWWKIVQTTWRLMQQHITVRRNERPARPQRREAKRMGVPEHDVTVVTLRRERSKDGNDEPLTEMHYTHRFIVGGHWRNQFYPSTRSHRQIWIAPYEKGPEGAPLIIKPRAYAWTR